MKGSFQIARLFGIPVQLHWTFGFVLVFIVYYALAEKLEAGQLLWVCLAAFGLFTSILLHEFGHALTARRYGVETKDIILLPIGGLARLTKLPERPFHEFLVAIAGPIVNFLLALLLLPYLVLVSAPRLGQRPLPTPDTLIGDFFYFVPFVFAMNVGLAVFNLLPAFPMDGGRILRALLTLKLGRFKATRIAVALGQLLAAGMIIWGIRSNNYSYAFIGLFIFFTAMQELRWAKTERLLLGLKAGNVARTHFTKLYLRQSMGVPAELLDQSQEKNFLVFDEYDQVVGTLSEHRILESIKENRQAALVSDYFQPGIETVERDSTLKEANDKMRDSGIDLVAVTSNGGLWGMVDAELVDSAIKLHYLHGGKGQGPSNASE